MSEQFAMGYIPSKKDLRDYKLNKKVCCATNLPETFEVQHSKIKNQGAVCSCVAHSVSEVLEELNGLKTGYSTAWIYGYRPFGYYQGQGMMTSDALKTTNKVGCIRTYDCPGNYEFPEAKEYIHKNLQVYKDLAKNDKVVSYAKLYDYNDIKEAIYKTGKPIVLCIRTDNLTLDENYIAQIPSVFAKGGHAVVCYGWNEIGLLIQNSWGSKWGNNGCFILPYEYGFTEAWVLTKDSDVVIKPGGFVLRKIIMNIINAIIKLFTKKK